jgi:DNA-binding HxlR family transcriptional regulator
MAALDLLGRRWTLRLLWELRDGPVGPRAILANCAGLSSSVLYRRIAELDDAGLVERLADGRYGLTGMGRDLSEAITPLNRWSERWARAAGRPPTAATEGELSQPG